MISKFKIVSIYVLLSFLLLIIGCTATPSQPESLDYRARAETQAKDSVNVSAVVLSPQETQNSFSLPLEKKGIQPVWIKIENQEDQEFTLMLLSIDPEYFSPSEVAWKFKAHSTVDQDEDNKIEDVGELIDFFLAKHIPVVIPPYSTVSGYVYTHLDPGVKAYSVELIGVGDVRSFEFAQLVPGFEADFMRVDFQKLYQPDEIQDLDLDGLREYLEKLPCCVFGGDRKTPGDPLNLVIVGNGRHILATLVRRGWDLTETVRSGTAWRTIVSSVFGAKYRTSPVSPLYLFGRSQDAALQKARNTVDERNHLRLWLAPVTLQGQSVWVGQISRDIGVKLSSKTIVTHKVDPVIDEARLYITLDLGASQAVRAFGHVKGVGYSDREAPRFNYTKDPYYTDGLRVVLILGEKRQPLDKIEFLKWEETKQLERKSEYFESPVSE
ncbi:MAG: LssY C-terminal domain-containing protein [Gammaproteobacteria bacterium]|jgi:hypothetical protein